MKSKEDKLRDRVIFYTFQTKDNYNIYKENLAKFGKNLFNNATYYPKLRNCLWHSACLYIGTMKYNGNDIEGDWLDGGITDLNRCLYDMDLDTPIHFILHRYLGFLTVTPYVLVVNMYGEVLYDYKNYHSDKERSSPKEVFDIINGVIFEEDTMVDMDNLLI